jgi:hypothetical protein
MPKDPSPLLGYNNNIRHRNKVFHVQTEDSGVKHPHIITHLFMDGGRILKSIKTSYAQHVGAEKMSDVVRQLMKDQHKAMLIALRDGEFDAVLDGADSPKGAAASRGTAGSVKPSPTAARKDAAVAHAATVPHLGATRTPDPPANARAAAARKSSSVPSPLPPPASRPPPLASRPPPSAHSGPKSAPRHAAQAAGVAGDEDGPPTMRMPPRDPGPEQELTLDIDALERATESSPTFEPQSDLPPPPPNLFRPKEPGTDGGYRTVGTHTDEGPSASRPAARLPSSPPPPSRSAPRPSQPPPSRQASRPAASRPPSSRPPGSRGRRSPAPPHVDTRAERPSPPAKARTPPPPAPASKGGEARYAPARPAAIFGHARPRRGNSIFGEDLISDKSLDEVILSYLAEDLEAPSADKPGKGDKTNKK